MADHRNPTGSIPPTKEKDDKGLADRTNLSQTRHNNPPGELATGSPTLRNEPAARVDTLSDGERSRDPRDSGDDDFGERGKESGTSASADSNGHSTRRNLSNAESSLPGTSPPGEAFREERMSKWLDQHPWPSGPSFNHDSLTNATLQARGANNSTMIASVGTGFPGQICVVNYPRQLVLDEIAEANGETPRSRHDGGN